MTKHLPTLKCPLLLELPVDVGVFYTGHYSFYTCRATEGSNLVQSVVVEQLATHGYIQSYTSVCPFCNFCSSYTLMCNAQSNECRTHLDISDTFMLFFNFVHKSLC